MQIWRTHVDITFPLLFRRVLNFEEQKLTLNTGNIYKPVVSYFIERLFLEYVCYRKTPNFGKT
jgi:hypothetical protein